MVIGRQVSIWPCIGCRTVKPKRISIMPIDIDITFSGPIDNFTRSK